MVVQSRTDVSVLLISGNEKSQLESMALFWSKSFNLKHKNWMVKNFSVPSNIIRFDYVLNDQGDLNVFEIETLKDWNAKNTIKLRPVDQLHKALVLGVMAASNWAGVILKSLSTVVGMITFLPSFSLTNSM